MKQEIERKFLVKNGFQIDGLSFETIKQGYISSNPERSVRIRITKSKAFLTIKGKTNKSGTTRFEFEKEIGIKEAEKLLFLCENNIIEKTRYFFINGKHTFEIDVFKGMNKGLILAEIELNNENESFIKPAWIDKEVTGDKRYYNLYLSKNPYNTWKSKTNNKS